MINFNSFAELRRYNRLYNIWWWYFGRHLEQKPVDNSVLADDELVVDNLEN